MYNLRTIRACKGLSAKRLSELCKLKQIKRISDIEEGRGKPSIEEIISICKILEVKIDDMINNEVIASFSWKAP